MDRRPPRLLGPAIWAVALLPHVGRPRAPSIYADDAVRIAGSQTTRLGALLFRPFNEHVAPWFEVVGWAAWRLGGGRLEGAARAFTGMSLLPFVLSLAMVQILIRRETGSRNAGLAAVAMLGLSPVYVECAWWFSASSFTWALLFALTGLWCVGRGPSGGLGSFLSALLAPASSGIGLLAGPLAATRAIFGREDISIRRKLVAGLWPLAGTTVYLAGVAALGFGRVVATESARRHPDLGVALAGVGRAPVDALIAGMLGLRDVDLWMPRGLDLALSAAGLLATLTAARRSPRRGLLLGGLLLIVAGYGLAYVPRATTGPHWLLKVQRYHLFPQLGLILVASPLLERLDRARVSSRLAALWPLGLALVLFALNRSEFQMWERSYRFPDQPRTLAALERVAEVARLEGITRGQALGALDPIRTRWFPIDMNPLAMLPPCADGSRVADDLVRDLLLAPLSTAEREALCGGMDASPYLSSDTRAGSIAGRRVAAFRVVGDDGAYVVAEAPAYLEFAFEGVNFDPTALGLATDAPLEVWWADPSGRWSETRSVRWGPGPGDRSVPLSRLPHWPPTPPPRVRLLFREAGPVAVGPPRLRR